MRDKFVEEYIKNRENEKKKTKRNRIIVFFSCFAIILTIIIAYLCITNAFADNVVNLLEDDITGDQYLFFQIEHNFTTAIYKYYGYGYTVALEDTLTGQFIDLKISKNETAKQVFLPNNSDLFTSEFEDTTEKVQMYIYKFFDKYEVADEYYFSPYVKVHMNGRLGLKAKVSENKYKLVHLYDSLEGVVVAGMPEGHETGVYTTVEDGPAPLNGDEFGIRNSIEKYYKTSWSKPTYEDNLPLNFNIQYQIDPPARYDVLYVEYKCGDKIIKYWDKVKKFAKDTLFEVDLNDIPEGYEYNGTYEQGSFMNIKMEKHTAEKVLVKIRGKSLEYRPKQIHVIVNCDELPPPDQPIEVDIEYRKDKINGEQLLPKETVIGNFEKPFYFNSKKIEDMKCIGYYIVDKNNNSVFVEDTAVSLDYLPQDITIVFIYEDIPVVVLPKCVPQFDSICNYVDITMKKGEFEKTNVINVMNHDFGIKNVVVGYDQNVKIDGEHKYMYYDFYVYDTKDNGDVIEKWDNVNQSTRLSFGVDKSKFKKVTDELYVAKLTTTYLTFCSCTGVGVNMRYGFDVNVHLIENKPPVADFKACTKVEQENGKTRTINEVYIEQQAHIKNNASDPNGIDDIKTINWTFVDNENNEYTLDLYRRAGKYYIESSTLDDCYKIHFAGITDEGDVLITFLTDDTWKVTQLVKDTEALQDIYTDTIKPKKLDLRPIALLTDEEEYRFPAGIILSGKENRIIGLSSKYSEICNFFKGTSVKIDHDLDYLEIIPLDNQDLKSIYFINDIDSTITDKSIVIENCNFTSQQLMFKQTGKYKLRLKVTDTNGNESEYTEEILTIVEDAPPTAIGSIGEKYFRDKTGVAVLTLKNIVPSSIDGDKAIIEKITYKYDSNNDGSFDDEKSKTLKLKESQVSISTKNLGKYQFIIEVKEEFGQPTIEKHINKNDYKRAVVTFVTEVDNMAPQVIEFRIEPADD